MSTDGSSIPRRALGPLPTDEDAVGAVSRSGFTAVPDVDPLTDTGMMRRLQLSEENARPSASTAGTRGISEPLPSAPRTPVPPPRPVLPEPEGAAPAAQGRRYSATDVPYDSWAAPRRSAASAASPPSAFEPFLPPLNRPVAPPAVTVPVENQITAVNAVVPAPAARTEAPKAPIPPSNLAGDYPQSITTAPTASGRRAATAARAVEPQPTGFAARRAEKARLRAEKQAQQETEKKARLSVEPVHTTSALPPLVPTPAKTVEPASPFASTTSVSAPTPAMVPTAPTTGADAAAPAAAPQPGGRRPKPALVIIAAVAAVILLMLAAIWFLTTRSTSPSGAGAAGQQAQDPLVTAADLGSLGNTSWGQPLSASGTRPICLPASADDLPAAQRSASRKIPSTTSDVDAVIQVIDTYADAATATKAYAVRLAQSGTCASDTALITAASSIDGLADSANAVMLTVQDTKPVHHVLLLTRTGRAVSMVDVATATETPVADVAKVTATALNRQCDANGGEGACPASIKVSSSLPAAGAQPGWLVPADLPRITAGAGRWIATDNTVNTLGSQCEVVNLNNVSGATANNQRTLLLGDDPKAPSGFGVDQVTYTLSDNASAAALAKKLNTNISGCASRTLTAKVDDGPDASGTGANGVKYTGSTYLITQSTNSSKVLYRVALITVGKQVVYLLANPSATFDFTDADWKSITQRAGQRVSQLS